LALPLTPSNAAPEREEGGDRAEGGAESANMCEEALQGKTRKKKKTKSMQDSVATESDKKSVKRALKKIKKARAAKEEAKIRAWWTKSQTLSLLAAPSEQVGNVYVRHHVCAASACI